MSQDQQNQIQRSESVEIKVYDIDQAIKRAGGFGVYQLVHTFMFSLIFTTENYILFNLDYLTLVPVLR